jgi:8-oxo-dGTP pyrophosphatase MutT (NUDIX family)
MPIDVIDHPDAEHPARPAATLVLVRDGDGEVEVLMIERGAGGAFGGVWAFPGGVVEDDDVPPGTAPDPLPAARVAAVRETHEEVGLVVDTDSLVYWSHWLPPATNSLSTKRFSTWFFVAPAHDDDHHDDRITADTDEVVTTRWLPPAVVLGMQERGEIDIVPPTYVTLTQLARYGDVGSLLAAADPRSFATEVVVDGDTRICLWHGDVAYGGGDPHADGPRHRLAMDERTGWRYLNTAG